MTRPTPPYVRNVCIARGHATQGVLNTVYTVPPNFVLLLKGAYFNPTAAGAGSVTLYVQAGDTGLLMQVITQALTEPAPVPWEGWIALNAGDMVAVVPGTQDFTYWLSGAVLPFAQ